MPVPAVELRNVSWVYGTFDVTAETITVYRRKSGPFGKAGESVYPLADIGSAEIYGSNLALRLHNGEVRGIQHVAQPEAVATALSAFGIATTHTEAAEIATSGVETGHRGEIRVKTYKDGKEYERDARKMMAQGWESEGQSSKNQKTAIGRTAGKALLTGGVGLILMGRSKKGDTLTPILAPGSLGH